MKGLETMPIAYILARSEGGPSNILHYPELRASQEQMIPKTECSFGIS